MVFIAEAFLSGCISKIINDGKDYSWNKIKGEISDRNYKSLSVKVYRVIEGALIIVTGQQYKDSDDLHIATEEIFNEFKNHGDTMESIKCGLNILGTDASDQRCENFLEKFYEGIRRDDDLYKAVIMNLEQMGVKISQEEFQRINEKIDDLTEIVGRENDNKINMQKGEPVKSRTQEYAGKWNENMFLNDFDKRDQKAGTNVKLKEVYLEAHLPHYIWCGNDEDKPSTDLKELLSETVNDKRNNKMLLVFGQPGIGKSTLITWMTIHFADIIDDILVYKFASDLGNVNWENGRISNRVLEELGLSHSDLNGKILILDGFDEVSIESNSRRSILDSLYGDWIYNETIKNFCLIITCRENYVQRFAILKCKYITLQPWDENQIKSFCSVYQEKIKGSISVDTAEKLLENKEILGIPLILYMVLALNISIEKTGSIVDIYDKIFSLDGGIYDRCINNKYFADRHRISVIKQQIHQISRNIAIWMFENNPAGAYIPKHEYQMICADVMQEPEPKEKGIQADFLIGNYFKLVKHCEGIEMEQLYFVHRSIYEYFVAETIYDSMSKAVHESAENLAGVFGKLLKRRVLSKEILQYLKYKIRKSHLKNEFRKVNDAFRLMLENGMTYYAKEHYKNIIDCELRVFKNMLEIVHIWDEMHNMKFDNLVWDYLKYNKYPGLNMSGMVFTSGIDKQKGKINLSKSADLPRVCLRGANLQGTSLKGADLTKADLGSAKLMDANFSGTDLSGADLSGADLSGTNFSGAKFSGADLSGSNLMNAIFDEKQIKYLEQDYDLGGTKVYTKETVTISYEEYCKRKISETVEFE